MFFSYGLQSLTVKGAKEKQAAAAERAREREKAEGVKVEEFPFSLTRSVRPLFLFLCFLSSSPRLLLLVVDRDSDDGRASADHADGREAPLELAVGHLFEFFWVFFFSFVSASLEVSSFFSRNFNSLPPSPLLISFFPFFFKLRTDWTSYMCLAWM